MSKAGEIANIANTIVLLGSVGGALVGGLVFYDEIKAALATKEYHVEDSDARQEALLVTLDEKLKPIAQNAREGVSNTLPPRIQNLLKLRCSNPSEFVQGASLATLLETLLERYEDLNDRQFRTGECKEGAYYNALGQLVD